MLSAVHYYHLLPLRLLYRLPGLPCIRSVLPVPPLPHTHRFRLCHMSGLQMWSFRLRLSHSGICSYHHLSLVSAWSGTGFLLLPFHWRSSLPRSSPWFLLPCRYLQRWVYLQIFHLSYSLQLLPVFQSLCYLLLLRLLCRLFCLLCIRSAGFPVPQPPHTHRFRLCHMSGLQRWSFHLRLSHSWLHSCRHLSLVSA